FFCNCVFLSGVFLSECHEGGSIPDSCNTAFRIPYSYGSRLFKRSPSISEDDALYCCRGLNCNHLGAIHNGPGISGFVAHLMVGNMYRICCFNVVGLFAFCFASSGTAEEAFDSRSPETIITCLRSRMTRSSVSMPVL